MRPLIADTALLVAGCGVLAVVAGGLATRRLLGGLGVGLDLLLAAGLLRLSSERTLADLAAAAAIVAVRMLVVTALRGRPPTLPGTGRVQEHP